MANRLSFCMQTHKINWYSGNTGNVIHRVDKKGCPIGRPWNSCFDGNCAYCECCDKLYNNRIKVENAGITAFCYDCNKRYICITTFTGYFKEHPDGINISDFQTAETFEKRSAT